MDIMKNSTFYDKKIELFKCTIDNKINDASSMKCITCGYELVQINPPLEYGNLGILLYRCENKSCKCPTFYCS